MSNASIDPTADLSSRSLVTLRNAQTRYANFCRVSGTPEELVFDFALEENTLNDADHPLVAPQRIALQFYTAKRLLMALQAAVQHHESVFGRLETDVERRMIRPPG